ncbi:glycosyltransferase [Halorubrum ezzemoulense]|uniref:glycosyltransferase n=1 Tax=Halorubrum ezzemoulense TaxID=337243 RepID=UPI00232CE7DA|nr:glycosyltransferase [Halorubrum ezzemoulense]MDB2272605.1 glycosyltransferase [Halorubrum ezzemoulense]
MFVHLFFSSLILLIGSLWVFVSFYNLVPLINSSLQRRFESGSTPVYIDLADSKKRGLKTLPTIDVLLPAYQEGNVIQQSIRSIRATDYPQEKININILLEPDDSDTQTSLEALQEQYTFTKIVVPEGYPGDPNKPRALNYGFEKTDGELVGIIDAEDIVSSDLFRQVSTAIMTTDADYVQGILDMVNEADGWRNLVFRGEYSYRYRVQLPAYHRANYPIPLGGTTNFFDREVLKEVSQIRISRYPSPWTNAEQTWLLVQGFRGMRPWDPNNVTEDFELGLLLWDSDFKCQLLNIVTHEESPLTLTRWIKQRTRWQKGKSQTLFQYLRYPPQTLHAKFHMLGQSFMAHYGPINLIGVSATLIIIYVLGVQPTTFISYVLVLGLVFAIYSVVIQVYSYWRATDTGGATKIVRSGKSLVSLPAYWVLQWIADVRALRQLYGGDYSWEKTKHHGRNESVLHEDE